MPLRTWDAWIGSTDNFFPHSGTDALRIESGVANVGAFSLEVRGVPTLDPAQVSPTDPYAGRTQAAQCVEWVENLCIRTEEVGTFSWRANATQAWYIPDFLKYELRRLLPDGSVDSSPEGLVSTHSTTFVCPHDLKPVTGPRPTSPPGPYGLCTSARMGMSPGWLFELHATVRDQYVPIADVPDGRYAVVVTVDAAGLLFESDETDNVTFRRLELSEQGSKVRLLP